MDEKIYCEDANCCEICDTATEKVYSLIIVTGNTSLYFYGMNETEVIMFSEKFEESKSDKVYSDGYNSIFKCIPKNNPRTMLIIDMDTVYGFTVS